MYVSFTCMPELRPVWTVLQDTVQARLQGENAHYASASTGLGVAAAL
jgi:hypothetical protein